MPRKTVEPQPLPTPASGPLANTDWALGTNLVGVPLVRVELRPPGPQAAHCRECKGRPDLKLENEEYPFPDFGVIVRFVNLPDCTRCGTSLIPNVAARMEGVLKHIYQALEDDDEDDFEERHVPLDEVRERLLTSIGDGAGETRSP